MKSANRKLTLVLLMLLLTLGLIIMVVGRKNKSTAEKPAERSTRFKQEKGF